MNTPGSRVGEVDTFLTQLDDLLNEGVTETAPQTVTATVAADSSASGASITEQYPEWPRIVCSAFYNAHGSPADAAPIKEHINTAHVVLLEMANGGAQHGYIIDSQALANTDARRYGQGYLEDVISRRRARGTFQASIMRGVYGTGKHISSLDLRDGDPLTSPDILQAYRRPQLDGSMETILRAQHESKAEIAAKQRQREGIMAPRLAPWLGSLLLRDTRLLLAAEVRVLLQMGRVHYPTFSGELAAHGFDVSSFVYGEANENNSERLVRTLMAGDAPDSELLARAYFEDRLDQLADDGIRTEPGFSESAWASYLGKTATVFTAQDITAIHQHTQTYGWSPETADSFLAQKGLPSVPRTVQRLMESTIA